MPCTLEAQQGLRVPSRHCGLLPLRQHLHAAHAPCFEHSQPACQRLLCQLVRATAVVVVVVVVVVWSPNWGAAIVSALMHALRRSS